MYIRRVEIKSIKSFDTASPSLSKSGEIAFL